MTALGEALLWLLFFLLLLLFGGAMDRGVRGEAPQGPHVVKASHYGLSIMDGVWEECRCPPPHPLR